MKVTETIMPGGNWGEAGRLASFITGWLEDNGFPGHDAEVSVMIANYPVPSGTSVPCVAQLVITRPCGMRPVHLVSGSVEESREDAIGSMLRAFWAETGVSSVEELGIRWAVAGRDAVRKWLGRNHNESRTAP